MKKKFTLWKHYRGLLLLSLLWTMQLSLTAQVSHAVGVTAGTFTPDVLTIHVGDTVVWTNTEGNHNVNGTTGTFPSNPESFGNEVGPPGWELTHVFTKAGVYDYHCDPHAEFGMVGKVIVLERTSYAISVTAGTFTPDSLTIYVGDTVVWTNLQGNHNVNASTDLYPGNPESFGNEVGPPGWVFSHVFTQAGTYDYQCDPHVQWGMVGKVIVMERTSHQVKVSNGTFTPDSLTINVGDTVVWTNTQGNHNVNASTDLYPSNPESFGNEVAAPGWVFSHVFTQAGVYDYQCDPHVQWGMVGKVIVVANTTGLSPKTEISEVFIYPNPVVDQFFISSEKTINSISIFSVTGAKILEYGKIDKNELELSLEGFRTGVYLLDVQFDDNTSSVSRLVKR